MAPNSDETGRLVALSKNKSGWNEDTLAKEKQRPPIYNPEDYAISLKKWGRRPVAGGPGLYTSAQIDIQSQECSAGSGKGSGNGSHSGAQRDYRNPMLTTGASGEMTLRQFGTVSELLTKLRADLRLAFPSFVQEFIGDPLDGVTLLLELLRAIQLSQASSMVPGVIQPATSQTGTASAGNSNAHGNNGAIARIPPAVQRRALLDELACLQCLHCCCLRYSEAVRRLTASSAGLFTLAVCIMSNVNKSRIIALELLTKACEPIGNGHSSVSEALSTLRLRFGEPVRFRFLVGMLTSAGQCELLTAGLKFVNTFLDTSGNIQKRLYIQAELEQAGFDIEVIKKIVNINSSTSDQVFIEIERWEKGLIDVESFSKKVTEFEKENGNLKEKIALLERRVQILQEEKGVLMSLEQCLKERCCELQDEVTSLKSEKAQKKIVSRDSSLKIGNTSPAEDEGISSSERSLSPDDQREPLVYELYNVQNATMQASIPKDIKMNKSVELKKHTDDDDEEEETTIEEVIEELRNIINDAETEAYASEKKEAEERRKIEEAQIASKIQMRVDQNVLIEDEQLLETEAEIVPSNLHPQPPRRTRSLVHLYIPAEEYEYHQKEMYFENETQFMSDESSDSLLSASKCQITQPPEKEIHMPINNNRELLNTIMDARDKAIQQEKRRQKKYEMMKALKRSESFQHMIPNAQIVEVNEKTKTIKQNSFDGLYFVTNFSNTPTSTPLLSHPKMKTKSKDDFAQQKVKSKSLDRIDDGLDAMVDIIVTSDHHQETSQQRLIDKSDSGVVTETTVSRSTSNLYSQIKKDPNSGKYSVHSQPKYEEKHRIFLPINKYENRDISETHFYFPRIQETSNNFMIKRGHVNAGLYSGHHVVRDSPASIKKPTMISTNNYRSGSSSRKNTVGKLTDLPSGLY